MPMREETWRTPLLCVKNEHRDERPILWKIHTIEDIDEPTNQVPEIRVLCRYPNCDSLLEVADGWLPYLR
jgi:hypothetical protein